MKKKNSKISRYVILITILVVFVLILLSYFNVSHGYLEVDEMRKEISKNNYSFKVAENPAITRKIGNLNIENFSKRSKSLKNKKVSILEDIPAKYDSRELGVVTPIKDQGEVGTCWAFSTTAAMEVAIAKKDNVIVDLSEQFLMAVNTEGYGTNGGWFAHHYHINPGAVLEEDFPYQGKDGIKFDIPDYNYKYIADDWGYVDENVDIPNVNILKSAIYKYGSLSVAVYADRYFQYYKGGIFDRNRKGNVNHAVNLIGWDDEKKAWILENSWGTKWGENGFMYIKYGTNQIGYAASYVTYSGLK